MQRWAAFLAGFDYKLVHIKGAQNYLADYLSRNPSFGDMSVSPNSQQNKYIETKKNDEYNRSLNYVLEYATKFLSIKKFNRKQRAMQFFTGSSYSYKMVGQKI